MSRHGRAMHRAIRKHKARLEFDFWLFDFAHKAMRAEHAIRTLATALTHFGVH